MAQPTEETSSLPSLNLLHDVVSPYLDLVAIHGILDHDPAKAWTLTIPPSKLMKEERIVSWLGDDGMLSSQISNLRIWSFGYNVAPLKAGLKSHIETTTFNLKRLLHEKILDVSNRPIIFLCHGYGGLLAFKAVLEPGICDRTIGVVCLGTAFRGVEIENGITDTLPIPGRGAGTIAAALEDDLPELLADFRSARGTERLPIRLFYETEPVRAGSSQSHLVPREAAVLNDSNAITFELDDVNHLTMNKFKGPDDHNYELMCDVLKGVIDHAYPVMLQQAIINNNVAYAKRIIEEHTSSFRTNDDLNACLLAAVSYGTEIILQMMLDANIRVNSPLTPEGDTALLLAVQSSSPNRIGIVRRLLKKGADVSIKNEEDRSALDYAEALGDQALETLLKNRPLIEGPTIRKDSYDWIRNPELNINDFGSSEELTAKVADIYEIDGQERTFLRTPSVHDLIYTHGPNHLMNRARSKEATEGTRKFRWLHLPANNLLWIKDLIQRTYKERTPDAHFTKDYYKEKCSEILDPSHWEDLVVTSPLPELSHIRHMIPRCRTMPYVSYPEDRIGADMILFMPYMHYELTSNRQEMARTMQEVRQRTIPLRPRANTPDQNAIWAYMRSKSDTRREMPLHVRRTLDQFYYDALDSDTPQKPGVPPRNEDQVTQRFMKSQKAWCKDDPLLIMVDQIWMVLLEDDTLITAFPHRWGANDFHTMNAVKDADIANIIAKELSNRERAPLDSAYDMMMLIINLCTGILFDNSFHQNEKLRFLEFFTRKIQQVTNEEAEAFHDLKTKFQQLSKKNKARDHNDSLKDLLDELLDITDEVDMINETKDIHDELFMISQIFDKQMDVLSQMGDLLEYRSPTDDDDSKIPPHTIKKWKKIQMRIEQRQTELATMDSSALRTYKNINNLFDMKQRQANVLEAHYSRKVAQDSSRQSTTIMVFTVVTIIFLPLSFMSSFYTLPIKEFPRDPPNQNQVTLPMSWALPRILGAGLSTAIFIILVGFGINEALNRKFLSKPISHRTTVEEPEAVPMSSRASVTYSTGASAFSTFTFKRRSTPLIFKPKRVLAEKPDGVSLFSYKSIVYPTVETPATLKINTGDSSPSTWSWISSPWRSSPAIGGTQESAEKKSASWDITAERQRRRRWGPDWKRERDRHGRISTV